VLSLWLDFENSSVLGRPLGFLVSTKEIFKILICLDLEFILIKWFIKQTQSIRGQHYIGRCFKQELGQERLTSPLFLSLALSSHDLGKVTT
jgi:hypothetical protein